MRRAPAAAGPIPVATTTRQRPKVAISVGHPSAQSPCAVPTREHQYGGQATISCPAHDRALDRAPPPQAPPGDVAAATPASRPVVLAPLRALRLDPGAPPPAQPSKQPRTSGSARNKRAAHSPLDKPFHISSSRRHEAHSILARGGTANDRHGPSKPAGARSSCGTVVGRAPGGRDRGAQRTPRKCHLTCGFSRADDGIRTRDPSLGQGSGGNILTCNYTR
jgi:hypothetical protein